MKRPLILTLVFIMIILNGFVFDVMQTDGHGHGHGHDESKSHNEVQVEMEH